VRSEDIEAVSELSPLQQGLLFHTLQSPQSEVYVVQVSYAFTSGLCPRALRTAWERVMEMHGVFRTSFHWEEIEKPLQVVHRRLPLPWGELDWRGLAAEEQERELTLYLAEERRRGFDLRTAPLMRLGLIRTGDAAYRFVWTHHHLLLDGWSMGIVLRDVFMLYEAELVGDDPLTAVPRPYRDYIAWLGQRDPARAEAYWRRQLAGFREPTPLPFAIARDPRRDSGAPCRVDRRLPLDLTGRLQALARQHRLTMNTLVQGAWAVLLSRYSGKADVVYGSTVSSRPDDLPGAESMVGLFINTLPVRVRVPDDAEVLPWLQALQAAQVEQRQFEYEPLVRIQAWSDVARGVPLFDTIVVFENYPIDERLTRPESGVQVEDVRSVERSSYLVSLTARPGERLELSALYDGERLDGSTVERILGHLTQVLDAIAAEPQRRLGEIGLLTPAEALEISGWRGVVTAYPRESTVAAEFARQVAADPGKAAVVLGEDALSYAELERRANRLAQMLQGRGVGRDTRVAVCLERSFDLVVALVGVLKAGGAYVPLDPAYPRERLRFMLEDVGAQVLITEGRVAGSRLPEHGAQVVDLERDRVALAAQPQGAPDCPATADSLAYIMYTSGSTGRPKGIAVPQRAVLRLVRGTDYADFGVDQVWLQYAPISFDASTLEIWGALLNGATLALAPPGPASLDDLGRTIARHGVTSLWLTAGLFHEMVDGNLGGLRPLRQLLAGGDVLSVPHVQRVLEELPDCRLINGYGPTENTTFTCCHTVDGVVPGRSIPIGRPIANTQVYILDAHMRQVPAGVPGELYAGGDGLARGYWNHPELTEERFAANPFGPEGSRLYRTGDLARWLPDGTVEFLGRGDLQVKVRGYRIEPAEIEAALCRHPDVREAAVIAARDRRGSADRLIAYVVPADGRNPDSETLRTHLRAGLPEYMVPSHLVTLPRLPLDPNGKLDRSALPDPVLPTQGHVAPRTDIEQRLAAIWAQVLDRAELGIHDNFFDLGGHSLLATRCVSQIRDAFQIELPLQDLFAHPTIAELAAVVDEAIVRSVLDAMGQRNVGNAVTGT